MTTSKPSAPPELISLLQRANQIGVLLPNPDDIDLTDPVAVADARLALAEFQKVHADILTLLACEREKHQ